jgi:Protein of unknown function (DUF3014)
MQPGASLEGADDEARVGSHVDDAALRHRYEEPPSAGRRALWWAVAAIIVVAVLAALYYLYWPRAEQPRPAPAEPPRAAVQPAPQPQAEQPIQHPIEAAKPDVAVAPEPAPPLPALDVSDQPVTDALASVLDRAALDEYLVATGLVRRIVVTVDNLTRKKAPQRMWPVKPTADKFLTSGAGDAVYISADNARRYEPVLKVMESVDTGKLAALYVRFYPLFQQAYRELGYPKGYFNDRLVEVIDHLLLTPEIDSPVRLAKPWIMYEFADQALEARSAGQKTLIRMGAANQLRVKAKLREFRRQIAGRAITTKQ